MLQMAAIMAEVLVTRTLKSKFLPISNQTLRIA